MLHGNGYSWLSIKCDQRYAVCAHRGDHLDELPVRYHYFTLLKTRQRGHLVYCGLVSVEAVRVVGEDALAAGVVDEADQVQWYRLQRVTVQA